MAQIKISELTTLAQQLQSADYVPVVHNAVTYKYSPYNYFVKNSGDETIAGVKTFSSTPIMTLQGGSASSVIDTIQLRKDTAANWAVSNPTLHQGEKGLETDTGEEKTGDGVTAWNSLGYSLAPLSSVPSTGTIVIWGGSASGSFSPIIQFGGSSDGVVHLLRDGYFEKIGNKVSFTIYIEISSKGGLSGALTVGNMPLVSGSHYTPVCIGYISGIATPNKVHAYVGANSTTVYIMYTTDAGGIDIVHSSMCNDSTFFMLSGSYFTV